MRNNAASVGLVLGTVFVIIGFPDMDPEGCGGLMPYLLNDIKKL